jgi:micrococcal nuclease
MARRFCRWPGLGMCLLAALVVGFLVRVVWTDNDRQPSEPLPHELLAAGPCEVLHIVDGHTLVVRQETSRDTFSVRLLGVALPASNTDRQAAAEELARLVPPGAALVELDKRRLADDGTWLAYLYAGQSLVNAEMLRTGFATHDVYPGDSLSIAQTLKAAQSEARSRGRGIWGNE